MTDTRVTADSCPGTPPADTAVDSHYGIGGLLQRILDGLAASGVDCSSLRPEHLAPVDEFHTRGKEATLELAALAQLRPGLDLLDVGCGLGGSVRLVAAEHGCNATGIDLTAEYIEVARQLAELVGLGGRVAFERCSALELPFGDASFDVVWTEHAQMNIADKGAFYREISRVLRPGGRLVFHDIFQGTGGVPHYPTPWAQSGALSALADTQAARAAVAAAGLDIVDWVDKSAHSLHWFRTALQRMQESGPPALGLHLLMGPTAADKFNNVLRNLEQGRITIVQGLACKPGPEQASALNE